MRSTASLTLTGETTALAWSGGIASDRIRLDLLQNSSPNGIAHSGRPAPLRVMPFPREALSPISAPGTVIPAECVPSSRTHPVTIRSNTQSGGVSCGRPELGAQKEALLTHASAAAATQAS